MQKSIAFCSRSLEADCYSFPVLEFHAKLSGFQTPEYIMIACRNFYSFRLSDKQKFAEISFRKHVIKKVITN